MKHRLFISFSLLIAITGTGPAMAAAPAKLESPTLRLTVTSEPYGFELAEKAGGQILLAHQGTQFTLGGKTMTVASAARVQRKGAALTAELVLSDPAHKARVSFAFKKPEVLQVRLELVDGKAEQIGQSFKDGNEHVYGVWE